jgi:hypothetical protein
MGGFIETASCSYCFLKCFGNMLLGRTSMYGRTGQKVVKEANDDAMVTIEDGMKVAVVRKAGTSFPSHSCKP